MWIIRKPDADGQISSGWNPKLCPERSRLDDPFPSYIPRPRRALFNVIRYPIRGIPRPNPRVRSMARSLLFFLFSYRVVDLRKSCPSHPKVVLRRICIPCSIHSRCHNTPGLPNSFLDTYDRHLFAMPHERPTEGDCTVTIPTKDHLSVLDITSRFCNTGILIHTSPPEVPFGRSSIGHSAGQTPSSRTQAFSKSASEHSLRSSGMAGQKRTIPTILEPISKIPQS